ncbi:MAG: hypothetical protein HUJ88_12720 [Fusobacterium necrophorum]|nr:hypothetical protein [Fusobacterium necrophorum]
MIIYDKLTKLYSTDELKKILGSYIYYYGFRKNNVDIKLDLIAKIIDLRQIYSYEDFMQDYGKKYRVKETKTLYNILISGHKLNDFVNLHKEISRALYKGFYSESKSFVYEQLKYIDIDYDISQFTYSFFKKHIELYGDKNELVKFKEKHKIDQKILWEFQKETWHIAIAGLLAEKIRYDITNSK